MGCHIQAGGMSYSCMAAAAGGDGNSSGHHPHISALHKPKSAVWENKSNPAMATQGPVTDVSDETALVELARSGDLKAFSDLIKRYEGKIFRLALHITQNREDAEDVLQEAFLKSYEHLDQFQGNSKFYTWIVR